MPLAPHHVASPHALVISALRSALFCLRLGAKRCFGDHLQQSHAGLSVLTEYL